MSAANQANTVNIDIMINTGVESINLAIFLLHLLFLNDDIADDETFEKLPDLFPTCGSFLELWRCKLEPSIALLMIKSLVARGSFDSTLFDDFFLTLTGEILEFWLIGWYGILLTLLFLSFCWLFSSSLKRSSFSFLIFIAGRF